MGIDLRINYLSSELIELSNIAIKAAIEGNIDQWVSFLSENSDIDGFELIFNYRGSERLNSTIKDARGRQTLEWLLRFSRASSTSTRGVQTTEDVVLSALWNSLQRKVIKLLESRTRTLPEKGYALYFTEGLQWCIVFSYKFSGNAAIIKVIHYTREPQSVYDIFALSHMSDEHTRTIIKNVVRSRSKVIIHRNVLIDVDRYIEEDVFGPTIDTLYLHEFLARLFSRCTIGLNHELVLTAMEVGSGNGLLTAGIADKCSSLKMLVAVDANIKAVGCTARNVEHVMRMRDTFSFYAVYGEFNSDLIKNKFDLVLSNPPYLPYSENDIEGDEHSRMIAIKGTELIETIVKNSPNYLSDGGALIMVYSQLAEQELAASVPEGMSFVTANSGTGYRVLFDLEDVMDNPKWLDFLTRRGLEFDSSSKAYHHQLKIGIIMHSNIYKKIPLNSIAGFITHSLGVNE